MPPASRHYEPGRAFLVAKESEAPGYGLYSYVLLGAPPTAATREGYLQAMNAYLEYLPPIAQLEEYRTRDRLNITYLPVKQPPPADVAAFGPKLGNDGATTIAATWILEHYDYARARLMLAALKPGHGDGPYLVSCLQPLSGSEELAGGYLRQNLSGAPPEFMRAWIVEFLKQAGSPDEWDRTSLSKFALTLRTVAVVSADRWPQIAASVKNWITVVQ